MVYTPPEWPPDLQDIVALASQMCGTERASVVLEGGPAEPDPAAGFTHSIPVVGRDGTRLGALHLIDAKPRSAGLTADQRLALERLARQTAALLEAQASARLYHAIFENAAVDLVLIEITATGQPIYRDLNRVHMRNSGFTRDAFSGRTAEELLRPDIVPTVHGYIDQCLRTGDVVDYEVTGPFPTGQRVRRSSLAPLRDETGRIAHVLLTSIDLTEMRRVEAQLRQIQKMEAIGQLTGGIAHDFNNLLTVILGSLERLSNRVTDPSLNRTVSNAIEATEKGASLTRQLLSVARREQIAIAPTDVNAVIGPMVELLRRSLGAPIAIETALAPELPAALGDAGQLEHMLLNLGLNARDAMPHGGRLTFRTAWRAIGTLDARSGLPPGRYVCIEVADTGIGMTREVLERAVEPFFTTKPPGAGSGLGLAQVYGLIRQFGGDMAIDSTPGHGTTVALFLRPAGSRSPQT